MIDLSLWPTQALQKLVRTAAAENPHVHYGFKIEESWLAKDCDPEFSAGRSVVVEVSGICNAQDHHHEIMGCAPGARHHAVYAFRVGDLTWECWAN